MMGWDGMMGNDGLQIFIGGVWAFMLALSHKAGTVYLEKHVVLMLYL